MHFDQLVDRILAKFDCDPATAVLIANERQARMSAEALFRLAETQIALTQAGVADYAVGDTVENVAVLQVGADTVPYLRATPQQMISLRNGSGAIDDPRIPGAFAMHADAAGAETIRLSPTPTQSNVAIIAWSVIDTGDNSYGNATALVVPRAVHLYLLDGCIASGYEIVEDRLDLAAPFEGRYEVGIQKLERYKNRRFGAGPTNVQRGW